MRCVSLPGFALTVPAVLLAADMFGSLEWDQAKFEDTCFEFAKAPDHLPRFPVTPAMRTLAVTQRRAAIEAIGAKAKAYFASPAFKQRWAEYVAPFYDKAEQQKAAEAQGQPQMDQALAQLEAVLPMLTPAQQEQVKAQIAKAKAQQAKKQTEPVIADDDAPPRDPKVAIRNALQTVLAATEGVDYSAALEQVEMKKHFANPVYEAKPEAWKMAFRAGREATEGARAFARTWLGELK